MDDAIEVGREEIELLALLSMRTGVPRSTVELRRHNWQGPALHYCAACLGEGVPYLPADVAFGVFPGVPTAPCHDA